jgi:Secretion system C-terminal sorting domain
MKKAFLMLVCVAIAACTYANHNPFKKSQEREKTMKKIKSSSFTFPTQVANISVATLHKSSFWDGLTSTWTPQSATKFVYENNNIKTVYEMDYLQSDTSFRVSYTYNSNNQLTQVMIEFKQSPGVYIPANRYTVIYSNNNLKTIAVYESYDFQTQAWLPNARQTQELNSRGANTRYLSEVYSNGVWETQFGYATNYTYLNSTSNKLVEIIDSSYSFNSMRFEADYRQVKSYNANAEVIDVLIYANNGFGLKLIEKDSIFYTAGVPSKLIGNEYDSLTNTFNRTVKLDNLVWSNFDPNIDLYDNQPISYITSSWMNNAWQLEERTTTTFTDNYGSFIGLTEVYNSNNEWVNQYRYKEIYDSRLNLIENADENYNLQTNAWDPVYGEKNYYQYDMSNNMTEEINEEFNSTNNAYEKTNKFEYSEFITIASGVNATKNILEVDLYPNPAENGRVFLNVNMEAASDLTIRVTDLKGSLIYTDKKDLGKGLNTLELNGLHQGLYLVELNTEYGVNRLKLVVK